ncbi:right-handed parallel beta-helix repeat-containing protein [Methylobacterium oryzihabitans]|nr:right-handed parallel beta-helix repeat-containing protein [Methylobacterium oryzihabitans]
MTTRPTARRLRLLALPALVLVTLAGARAADDPAPPRFEPATTRTLREFGATGRPDADDTAALARAFAVSDQSCLDGEGQSYRVDGMLRIEKSVCLRNATLVQIAEPFDTSRAITQTCPAIEDAAAVVDCGDPAVPQAELAALGRSLSIRTLLVRPAAPDRQIRINFVNVTVDRGRHPDIGSRSDSAGIWLQQAERIDLDRVEITGYGRGYGLMIVDSRNVTITDIHLHDMIWAPYRGDAPLTRERAKQFGWNSIPVREFRYANGTTIKESKFYGVRVQEGVTCGFVTRSTKVVVTNARVSRCGAFFDTGFLPWQADGFDIGSSSENVTFNRPRIDQVWEGIDVVAGGTGIRNLAINDAVISDVFAFGIKLGYSLSDVRVERPTVTRAAYDGIIVYGPVRNAVIRDAVLSEMGYFDLDRAPMQPWEGTSVGGIRLSKGTSGQSPEIVFPDGVTIERARVANRVRPGAYFYGFINSGAANARLIDATATGYRTAVSTGFK